MCSLPYILFPKYWRGTTLLPGKVLASAKAENHQGWKTEPSSIPKEGGNSPWLCLNRASGRAVGGHRWDWSMLLRWSRGSSRYTLLELGKLYFQVLSFWFLRAFSFQM